jgi:anti-anti-sigma factor
VLNDGNSVVVVRTESPQAAARACAVLDQLGIRMHQGPSPKSSVSSRQVDGVVVLDIAGKIALAEGTAFLRDTIRASLERGYNRIILNLEAVDFIDSAGLGELVRTHVAVRSRGGQLKLMERAAAHENTRLTTCLTSSRTRLSRCIHFDSIRCEITG